MSFSVILSILIISHNQKEKLQRCIESVLAQDLPFEHEIIISDDASIDGTWELILDYVKRYPSLIQGYQVNSNDCNPTNTSERSGHNRSNAYRYAKGKYFVHIDGDDYLRGTNCYKHQVEMLEEHPECSMCMQNIWITREGEPLENGHLWHKENMFLEGRIIEPKDFFVPDGFILNQAFVIKRNSNINPADLYHKFYVDDIITFHHLQFGPIICTNTAGYVYEGSSQSIMSSYQTDSERDIFLTLDLTVLSSLLIPRFTGLYFNCYKKDLLRIVNKILKGDRIEYRKETMTQFNAFICDACIKQILSFTDIIRLQLTRILIITIIKFGIKTSVAFNMLYKLLIRHHIPVQCSLDVN